MKSRARYWVLNDEYLDWKALADIGEPYSGLMIPADKAYEYVIEQEDIDYDDYLLWYVDTRPKSEPMITDILKEREAVTEWFFDDEWRLVIATATGGGK